MKQEEYIKMLRQGVDVWNKWRMTNPDFIPVLRDLDFTFEFAGKDFYDLPEFSGANFSNVDMHMSSLRNGTYCNCIFDGAKMDFTDLVDAYFESCTFKNASMRVAKIGSATFNNCIFENSDLSYCSAQETSFKGSTFTNTKLEHMSLVANDFSNTKIIGCYVYGISSWDLALNNSEQQDLIITPAGKHIITVDTIELAQFIYLMINNNKLRDVINTITSKVVLILGNFSKERKPILDSVRSILRKHNLIPVIFDFKQPETRNLTETVITLASMSKFVIADLSSPRSVPHELANIAVKMPSVEFYPIIVSGEKEYGMFEDYKSYPWIKPTKEYVETKIEETVNEILLENNTNV